MTCVSWLLRVCLPFLPGAFETGFELDENRRRIGVRLEAAPDSMDLPSSISWVPRSCPAVTTVFSCVCVTRHRAFLAVSSVHKVVGFSGRVAQGLAGRCRGVQRSAQRRCSPLCARPLARVWGPSQRGRKTRKRAHTPSHGQLTRNPEGTYSLPPNSGCRGNEKAGSRLLLRDPCQGTTPPIPSSLKRRA